jgi:hypothetical protein
MNDCQISQQTKKRNKKEFILRKVITVNEANEKLRTANVTGRGHEK